MSETDELVNRIITSYDAFLLDDRIKLTYIRNFLPDYLCEYLVGKAYDSSFQRSMTTRGIEETRTSSSVFIDGIQDDIVRDFKERIAKLVMRSTDCIEAFQAVKYESGQFFKAHWDYLPADYKGNIRQRQYTFFVYLNTVDNGGETDFPNLGLAFKPEKGCALFWENCSAPDKRNIDSFHQGKPPIGEIKYGLNIWVSFPV